MRDDEASLAEITFLLTLPFDAGIPEDDRIDLWSAEREPPGMWTPALLAELTEAPYVPDGGQYPWLRLEFRRGRTRSWPAPDLADRVFSDRVEEMLDRRSRWKRRLGRLLQSRGFTEMHTVVAASRYFWLDEERDSDIDDREDLMNAALAAGHMSELLSDSLLLVLERLGTFLSCVAMASGQAGRRVLLASDLPPMVPALLRFHHPDSSAGFNTVLSTQLEIPTHVAEDLPTEKLGFAHQMFEESLEGNEILRCLALLREAAALQSSGQYSGCVVFASTAVEMLCRATLRAHKAQTGDYSGQIPFREVLMRELPPLVDLVPADPPPGVLGRWHSGGYQTRNELVHEGKVPGRSEAQLCLQDGSAVCQALMSAIKVKPTLLDLRDQTPFEELVITQVDALFVPLTKEP